MLQKSVWICLKFSRLRKNARLHKRTSTILGPVQHSVSILLKRRVELAHKEWNSKWQTWPMWSDWCMIFSKFKQNSIWGRAKNEILIVMIIPIFYFIRYKYILDGLTSGFNLFQPCIAFHIKTIWFAVPINWFVPIWNATLVWNGLIKVTTQNNWPANIV